MQSGPTNHLQLTRGAVTFVCFSLVEKRLPLEESMKAVILTNAGRYLAASRQKKSETSFYRNHDGFIIIYQYASRIPNTLVLAFRTVDLVRPRQGMLASIPAADVNQCCDELCQDQVVACFGSSPRQIMSQAGQSRRMRASIVC